MKSSTWTNLWIGFFVFLEQDEKSAQQIKYLGVLVQAQNITITGPAANVKALMTERKTGRPVKANRFIGLRKVADVAGVSTATVSRVMNSPERVSPELRERVLSVVQHLGWIPDGTARAFSTRRTRTIGAVFPGLTHGDFARAAEGLQSELARFGYTLLLGNSDFNIDRNYSGTWHTLC